MTEKKAPRESGPGKVIAVLAFIAVCVLVLLELRFDFIPILSLEDPTHTLEKLLFGAIMIAVTWILMFYIGKIFEKVVMPKVESHAQVKSIWKMISYAIWSFILIIVLLSLVGAIGNMALYLGLIGAAMAFVLQKPLLNIGGWILITYRRLIRIGDRVEIGSTKGYVLDITPMYIELREFGQWMKGDTFTGRIVTVPNSLIFEQPINNYTRDFPFVWDEVVNLVTYESDIELAKKYILESAREIVGDLMKNNYEHYRRRLEIRDLDQLLLKEPELRMEFADSGVNIYVLFFCPVDVRRKLKSEISERIWTKFMADPKVGIAYPHMHIVGELKR